jgi:hypothetical protein
MGPGQPVESSAQTPFQLDTRQRRPDVVRGTPGRSQTAALYAGISEATGGREARDKQPRWWGDQLGSPGLHNSVRCWAFQVGTC